MNGYKSGSLNSGGKYDYMLQMIVPIFACMLLLEMYKIFESMGYDFASVYVLLSLISLIFYIFAFKKFPMGIRWRDFLQHVPFELFLPTFLLWQPSVLGESFVLWVSANQHLIALILLILLFVIRSIVFLRIISTSKK